MKSKVLLLVLVSMMLSAVPLFADAIDDAMANLKTAIDTARQEARTDGLSPEEARSAIKAAIDTYLGTLDQATADEVKAAMKEHMQKGPQPPAGQAGQLPPQPGIDGTQVPPALPDTDKVDMAALKAQIDQWKADHPGEALPANLLPPAPPALPTAPALPNGEHFRNGRPVGPGTGTTPPTTLPTTTPPAPPTTTPPATGS